jgi:hypothetical protein
VNGAIQYQVFLKHEKLCNALIYGLSDRSSQTNSEPIKRLVQRQEVHLSPSYSYPLDCVVCGVGVEVTSAAVVDCVDLKASDFARFQQLRTSSLLNPKGFPGGYLGGAPGPEPEAKIR